MKFHDFRIGWRFLVQEPAYSLVVVLGLSVGFAACMLLLGFVRYSYQYNAAVPDVDHVYVVKQRFNIDPKAPWFDQAPLLLRNAAQKTPGVVAATGYIPTRPQNNKVTVRIDGKLRELRSLTVLPGFADMLGLRTVQGDVAATLDQPDGIALTEAAAMRHFGTTNVIGRTFEVEGKPVRVGAVLQTPPANTTIPFEALVGVNSTVMPSEMHDELLSGAQGWWGKLLVRVRPGASPAAIAAALQSVVDHAPALQNFPPDMKARLGGRKVMDIVLGPLDEAYFDRDVAANFIGGPGDRGDPVTVKALGVIAILILALAAINYVNLATVRVLRRQREVAMRKVLGAGMPRLGLHFLAESMLVSMAATAAGLLLAKLALPLFSELMNRDLGELLSPTNVGAAVAIGAVLGLLTSLYPAWIATRVRPGRVLAGRPDTESARGKQLRRMLTVVQIAAAMGLAAVTLAIAWQARFSMQAAPGFDPAPLLVVDLSESVRASKKVPGFVAALSAQPAIAGVASSEEVPGRYNSAGLEDLKRPGGPSVSLEVRDVSRNFFELYGIYPLAGRLFDSTRDRVDDTVPLILDPIGVRELGFISPEAAINQTVLEAGHDGKLVERRIIGVAPEVRLHSLREVPRATFYELQPSGLVLSVRAAGSVAEAERAVESLWQQYFPDDMLEIQHAGAIIAANYAEDARLARLLVIATGIALVIAAFGAYVLAAHTVMRRAKEIVLRKLHGARGRDIGMLVAREFCLLVLAAAAVGLPIAAVAIERYLAGFVEHAPIGGWTLAAALLATLAVATIAMGRHAMAAMRLPPALALDV